MFHPHKEEKAEVKPTTGTKSFFEDHIEGESMLNLSNKGLKDEHMSALCSFLKQNPEIKDLNLSNNLLSSVAAIDLSTQDLESLNLSGNKITTGGASYLALNTSLTSLDLSNNNIGDVGAVMFKKNKNLLKLNIRRNNIFFSDSIKETEIKIEKNNAHTKAVADTSDLIAFMRANEESPIKSSFFPLAPEIRALVGYGSHTKAALRIFGGYITGNGITPECEGNLGKEETADNSPRLTK
jgi:hypothetical protein